MFYYTHFPIFHLVHHTLFIHFEENSLHFFFLFPSLEMHHQSILSLIFLNSFNVSPKAFPISGNFFGPNKISTATKIKINPGKPIFEKHFSIPFISRFLVLLLHNFILSKKFENVNKTITFLSKKFKNIINYTNFIFYCSCV